MAVRTVQKKNWIILAAILCVVVLGVTVWCVWGGIQSVLPDAPEVQEESQPEEEPIMPEEMNPPIDENGNLLDMDGNPVVDDNLVVDPWSEAPIEETESSETPSDSESISNDPDLAVSDEGWTGIY